uniref:Transmembrane proteins 14C n=1 Tax=Mesocestoides corti TaxID=53468 RepID=A0A5K3EVN6_MESCO
MSRSCAKGTVITGLLVSITFGSIIFIRKGNIRHAVISSLVAGALVASFTKFGYIHS